MVELIKGYFFVSDTMQVKFFQLKAKLFSCFFFFFLISKDFNKFYTY